MVTLTLALAWAVREGLPSPAPAATGAVADNDGQRASLVMQLAYGLSSEAPSGSVLLVPLTGADAHPPAAAAAGFVARGTGTHVRVLAWGLPVSAGSSVSRPEYEVEAYFTDGTRRALGPLTLTAQRKWMLDATLPYRVTEIDRIVILRRGELFMEANLALAERGLRP